MKPFRLDILVFLAVSTGLALGAPARNEGDNLANATRRLGSEITRHGKAYADLKELTTIGARLSGSEGAQRAVNWAKTKLDSLGLDRVWLQPVKVPHWTRGSVETAVAHQGERNTPLAVTALGLSVGTAPSGVTAPVVEVHGLDEVDRLGSSVRGKIVFYNRPMDASLPDTFEAYDKAVDQRVYGASRAAKYGAVAMLVRSMTTLPDDDHPHTGTLHYTAGVAKIPAAALSTHAANRLSSLLAQDRSLTLTLKLSAESLPDADSFNVIGEITGSALPSEYVVVGGHLDSWDLATGAHDDGAGVVQSIEVVRALRALGLKPKRSVRAVLFMAEEEGGVGGKEYARQAELRHERHIAAIESDRGGFAPVGFAVESTDAVVDALQPWKTYLAPLHADRLTKGESGTDVWPLAKLGTVTVGFIPESKHYFDIHHSSLDRLEAVSENELEASAAALAAFTYCAAEKGIPQAAKAPGR